MQCLRRWVRVWPAGGKRSVAVEMSVIGLLSDGVVQRLVAWYAGWAGVSGVRLDGESTSNLVSISTMTG